MTSDQSRSTGSVIDGAPLDRSDRTNLVLWVVIPLGVVLALFVALLATRDPGGDSVDRSIEGNLAPSIEGVTTEGASYDLDDQRGEWVVVNFFSTNCQPCIIEHPELVSFAEDNAGDAGVVSIAFDDRPDNVREFFADNGGEWPVLVEDTGGFAVSYGVTGVPESYLVAPNGAVARKIIGGVTQDELETIIDGFDAAA